MIPPYVKCLGTPRTQLRWYFMSQISSYLGYAAKCSKLAREASSAGGRRILLKLAADWLTLAGMVAKRQGKAERN